MSDVILPVQTKYLQVNKVTIKSDKFIHSFFFFNLEKGCSAARELKNKRKNFSEIFHVHHADCQQIQRAFSFFSLVLCYEIYFILCVVLKMNFICIKMFMAFNQFMDCYNLCF